MTLENKKTIVSILSLFFLLSLLIVAWIEGGRARVVKHHKAVVTKVNKDCVDCHNVKTPGIVGQWKESLHSKSGIGCMDCHSAEKTDPDVYKHEGVLIATIVSPKDCGKCHEQQAKEFQASHHSEAGKILGSLDNVLAEVVEGYTIYNDNGDKEKVSPAAVSGCLQCHGSEIKMTKDGKIDPATWPNTGMGRLNPDGSKGACSACHVRHNFSRAQARMPENCGRCHMGPDHPQLEVFNESKHGIAFAANRQRFTKEMKAKKWHPGDDFEQGPTCSVCHMGATKTLNITHDIGGRISWTLRPPISEKIDAVHKKKGSLNVKSWEDRRDDMKKVCLSCHGPEWVENWYIQFDNLVHLYNDKFGRPSTHLYKMARESGLMTNDITFDDKIEFTYFYLWHHEGRRARHGAAMMGPDYTQWHGMYEIAERFYHEFIPELKELIEHNKKQGGLKATHALKVEEEMHRVLNSDHHKWILGKMDEKEKIARKKASAEFKKRYAQD